jgi:hypothetical protein
MPPLKEQKFTDGDPPLHIGIFFFAPPPPPFSFLLVKWRFSGVIVLIIKYEYGTDKILTY